jgi:hypothetical protein
VKAFHPDTAVWEALPVADGPKPTPRQDFFYTLDAKNDRLILFAGDQHNDSTWACQCAGDTWALELGETPMRWVQLDDGKNVSLARRNGASATDPVGQRWFVWGGTPDGSVTAPGLWAFDLRRGHERWEQVPVDGHPPERTSGIGVYDASRRRVLFGFGNDPVPVTDLWAIAL